MYKIKLLISFYRLLVFIMIFNLVACSNLKISHNIKNRVYVADIQELYGMQLKNHLLVVFPNQNKDLTDYYLELELRTTNYLFLTNKEGFATKGNLIIHAKWKLIKKSDSQALVSVSNSYTDYYNIDTVPHANVFALQRASQNLTTLVAKDIAIKVNGVIINYEKNKQNESSKP